MKKTHGKDNIEGTASRRVNRELDTYISHLSKKHKRTYNLQLRWIIDQWKKDHPEESDPR